MPFSFHDAGGHLRGLTVSFPRRPPLPVCFEANRCSPAPVLSLHYHCMNTALIYNPCWLKFETLAQQLENSSGAPGALPQRAGTCWGRTRSSLLTYIGCAGSQHRRKRPCSLSLSTPLFDLTREKDGEERGKTERQRHYSFVGGLGMPYHLL